MAFVSDRSTPDEARWQVRWKPRRDLAEVSHTFLSPPAKGRRTDAEREALRLKLHVDSQRNRCGHDEALAAIGYATLGDEPPAAEIPTLEEYGEVYCERRTGVQPRTVANYRRELRTYICPTFGQYPVDKIDAGAVPDWVRSMEKAGCAPKSIQNRVGLLSSIMISAADAGLRIGNPCKGLRLHKAGSDGEEVEAFLTAAEWALLHRCLYRESPRATWDPELGQDIASVLVGTGVRWSELTALKVECVELRAHPPRIRVIRAWKAQGDGTHALGDTKGRKRRSISVGAELVATLTKRIQGKPADALVFGSTQGGGMFRSSHFYDRYWAPALKAAHALGLAKTPRVHDLRHTHASWLIAAGRPLPSIQRRLGHETITITIDRYGHLVPDVDRGDLDALDEVMRPQLRAV